MGRASEIEETRSLMVRVFLTRLLEDKDVKIYIYIPLKRTIHKSMC